MKNLIISLALILTIFLSKNSLSDSLNTDISQKTISISSNFTGKKILLFGAREIYGEIIIIIFGPKEKILVHQKKPRFVIWINSNKVIFSNVPSYYAIASSKPINEIISYDEQKRLSIGADKLKLKVINKLEAPKGDVSNFKFGLIRNKTRQNLYSYNNNAVKFNNKLFRSEINFPSNAAEGKYLIKTYLVKNNKIIDSQEKSIFIRKVGIERRIYNFANDTPALYGLFAIIIATLSGSIASIIFRKI